MAQVGDLQATGVAVWDLGESVRSSNLTSAPIIVRELDELSESLKTLAVELTRFFANVDGDVDGCVKFPLPFFLSPCSPYRKRRTKRNYRGPFSLQQHLSSLFCFPVHIWLM